jgi:MazG family protein
MYTFEDLVNITKELRSEHGCPWDKKQTHESLKPCLTEESGEVLEAIDHKDMENLCEELGDVLFQVIIHSQIAKENGNFTIEDVVNGISAKMIRRHPHVFGNKKESTPEEVQALWNQIKKQEKACQNVKNP